MGFFNNRFFCGLYEFIVFELCELVFRFFCLGNRCFLDFLVECEGLLFFFIFIDLLLFGKDKEGLGNNGFDSINVVCIGMVFSFVGDVLQVFYFFFFIEGFFIFFYLIVIFFDFVGLFVISGLDGYR